MLISHRNTQNPNLVNFGPQMAENGWRVFAHPINSCIGRHWRAGRAHGELYHASGLFLVFAYFLVPCARLRWPSRQFLSARDLKWLPVRQRIEFEVGDHRVQMGWRCSIPGLRLRGRGRVY